MKMTDDLEDDASHPIQRVNVIDVIRGIQGGGAAYGLVIARPLEADRKSLVRLKKKIEIYVESFFSEDARKARGTPTPGRMWIYVHVHKDSNPEAREVIARYESLMLESGIELIVSTIDSDGKVVE